MLGVRILALLLAIALLAQGAHAQAGTTRFRIEDYEAYFRAGRYETWSPFYGSQGVMEIVSLDASTVLGVRTIRQHARSLDVAANYDGASRYPNTKIVYEGFELWTWDRGRAAYLFQFSGEQYDKDRSLIWESANDRREITPDDVARGRLESFYRRADARAGEDADRLRAMHREDKVGLWSRACGFLKSEPYEVACAFTHLPTGRVEMFYYRRMDLVS